MRTMFHLHCDSKFNKYFTTAWSKLKKKRHSWKTNNNYGSSNEWNLLREPSVCKKGESVIDAVCRVLPSYEEIELHLEDYFKGLVFKTFKIVDPIKTIRDLEACFLKGPPSTGGSNHPILDLVYESPQNIHCVGVILEILRGTYYRVIPKELEMFSRFLTSSVPVKSFNIERLQCIMLKVCYFDFTSFSGCDFSRVYMLIQTACSLACTLGLNRDIEIPINSHDQVYIENLWWWILYMDVQVSFNLGTALQINDLPTVRFNYTPGEDIIFRKSILMLRSILEKIYDKNNVPSVKQLILDAKEFVTLNYKSLSYYMSPDSCDFNERIEVHTLLLLLTSISNLSNIQRYYFNDKGFEIFNMSIHLSFTSLYISIAVLNSYFKMDIEDPHYESP